MKPTTMDAYRLVHEGALALAEVEAAGFRIDVNLLDKTISDVGDMIENITNDIMDSGLWKKWKEHYGDKAKLGSRKQLGHVLNDAGLLDPEKKTTTGVLKTDESVLLDIDHPFVEKYLRLEKLKKFKSTFLAGIRREVVDGYLHPFFNLHLARTFRSSSDSPNFQNLPIRDKEFGKLIRSCFIPRDDHVLVEIDFAALEFRIAACFWRDKAMIEYASDSSLDIHRDMAAECYMLDEVPKSVRFYAKNQFVFPELYGSYYINCAKNLWNAIDSGGLQTAEGIGLREHLKSQGISKLGVLNSREDPLAGTFEKHIKEVEEVFEGRFPQWTTRKKKWWDKYQTTGRLDLMTGFSCQGVFSRNDSYNWPVQGPAFHIMLWSLTQIVKWLKKRKMKSRVVGTIHDSLEADVHKDELDEFIAKAVQVMTQDVREHWDWIVVPLEVEVETSAVNWYSKKELVL